MEELRRIYPWLVLEAKGGYHVPSNLEDTFRAVLTGRSAVHAAILDARRAWVVSSPIEHLDLAVSLLEQIAPTWKGLRGAIEAAQPSDGQRAFIEIWDADMSALTKDVESLRKLHDAQSLAKKMLASIASARDSTPENTLRSSIAATVATLSAWRGLLQSRPKALSALEEAEASVSRLEAALALDEAEAAN